MSLPLVSITELDGTLRYDYGQDIAVRVKLHQRNGTPRCPVELLYHGEPVLTTKADLSDLRHIENLNKHALNRQKDVDWHTILTLVAAALPDEAPVSAVPLKASKVSGPDLLALTVPPKHPYLDWLNERAIVMVYGPRGVGKTYWLLELALCLTMPRPFLKWPVHRTAPVLYVDGEMAVAELQERLRKLAGDTLPPDIHFLSSELVYERSGRDLTLTSNQDRLALDAMLADDDIKVLILDNISCLFPGLDESKKQDWEPINAWLIRLRHRGITVIVGHHAGKNGQQRGTSGREDNINLVVALTLPPGHQAEDGCHVHLRFEKTRGIKGKVVEALDVRLEDSPHGQVWTCVPLDVRNKERIKTMLEDGMSPKLIADELHISASYVYRCKREIGIK